MPLTTTEGHMPHTTPNQPGQELKPKARQLIKPFSARQLARLGALPNPELPDESAGDAQFWRAVWIGKCSELAAFNAVYANIKWGVVPYILANGLIAAQTQMSERADEALTTLIDSGGLLYAWTPEEGGAA
jgi:hypothetical protein